MGWNRHRISSEEENFAADPARTRTRKLSIKTPAIYQQTIPDPKMQYHKVLVNLYKDNKDFHSDSELLLVCIAASVLLRGKETANLTWRCCFLLPTCAEIK